MSEEKAVETTEVEKDELTIEVDGVQHPVSTLSDGARELIQMHQRWSQELGVQTDKVNQLRAAIQQVATQVVDTVREDAKPKEDAPAAEASSRR